MVHFTIQTLSGKTVTFDFNLNSLLVQFRKIIGEKLQVTNDPHYSLICNNKISIYENDLDSLTLKELFEKYNPDLLDKNEIKFYFTLNLGLQKKRDGIKIIYDKKRKFFEESNETSSLICPITQEPITDAIKINGRFYDLFAISQYLSNEYKKHLQDGHQMVCPLKMNISPELLEAINIHHQEFSIAQISASSLTSCLLHWRSQYEHQNEYNQLIINLQPKLKDPAIEGIHGEYLNQNKILNQLHLERQTREASKQQSNSNNPSSAKRVKLN